MNWTSILFAAHNIQRTHPRITLGRVSYLHLVFKFHPKYTGTNRNFSCQVKGAKPSLPPRKGKLYFRTSRIGTLYTYTHTYRRTVENFHGLLFIEPNGTSRGPFTVNYPRNLRSGRARYSSYNTRIFYNERLFNLSYIPAEKPYCGSALDLV